MKYARKTILSLKNPLYRIVHLSACYYRIMRYLFLMAKSCVNNPENMTGIFPSVLTIAKKSGCSERTVQRFLREYKDIVQVEYRFYMTSKYRISKDFYEAMRFLNCENKLDCSKRWVNIWIRKLLSYYEECHKKDTPPDAGNGTLSEASSQERIPLKKEESGFVYDPFRSLKDKYSPDFCEEIAKMGWKIGESVTQGIGNLRAKGQKVHDKTALGISLIPWHAKSIASKMMRERLRLRSL